MGIHHRPRAFNYIAAVKVRFALHLDCGGGRRSYEGRWWSSGLVKHQEQPALLAMRLPVGRLIGAATSALTCLRGRPVRISRLVHRAGLSVGFPKYIQNRGAGILYN